VQRLLDLQQTAGNQAVAAMVTDAGLGDRAEEATAPVATGEGESVAAPAAAPGTADSSADSAPAEDRTADAKAVFDKGAAAYTRGEPAHAYHYFTRADQITHRPGLAFPRAQCLRRLGARAEEAVALYQAYLDEGGGTRTAEAQAAIKEL